MSDGRPLRLRVVRADQVRPGMVLWSSATNRRLLVVTVHREQVPAHGNLYRDPEQPDDGPTTEAIVLMVMNEQRQTQRLGAYAPRAGVQVVARPLRRANGSR